MDMSLLSAHIGDTSDAAALGHDARAPFTQKSPSRNGRTTTFLSASPTGSASSRLAPLNADDFHHTDPAYLSARLEMLAEGSPDAHAAIRAAAHDATFAARELDQHLGTQHSTSLALPTSHVGDHRTDPDHLIHADLHGDLKPTSQGDEDVLFDEPDLPRQPEWLEQPVRGDHTHTREPGQTHAETPDYAHRRTDARTLNVMHAHVPATTEDAHGHDESEQRTSASPQTPVASSTEDALNQQALSMQQMLEYQTRASELNMKFKVQSDLLQSMQKMNSDSADAAKYQ